MHSPNSASRNNRDDHRSEEDIVFQHRGGDEPVSPTSGTSLDFNKPWKPDPISLRRKPKSLDDENESLIPGSFPSRSKQSLPQGLDLDQNEDDEEEEEVVVHETRSTPRSRARSLAGDLPDRPDEWSMAQEPPKDIPVEMTGALNVMEIAPKGSVDEEVDRRRVGAKVVKERRDERWTEITKDLVVREAIEQLGYEFEETKMFYYIFSFMEPVSRIESPGSPRFN